MGKSSSSSDNEIDELISQMEKELHVTTMQQSFERVSNEKEVSYVIIIISLLLNVLLHESNEEFLSTESMYSLVYTFDMF